MGPNSILALARLRADVQARGAVRVAAGLTQAEMAEVIRLSPPAIAQREAAAPERLLHIGPLCLRGVRARSTASPIPTSTRSTRYSRRMPRSLSARTPRRSAAYAGLIRCPGFRLSSTGRPPLADGYKPATGLQRLQRHKPLASAHRVLTGKCQFAEAPAPPPASRLRRVLCHDAARRAFANDQVILDMLGPCETKRRVQRAAPRSGSDRERGVHRRRRPVLEKRRPVLEKRWARSRG